MVARLKSLEGSCPLCRKRLQKRIHTAMGRIPQDRLEFSFPFQKIQADLLGLLEISEYVNSRGKRKIWVLSTICHFSRYVSLLPVESLSKVHILDAFRRHFLKYGESHLIECDFGSNFCSARQDLENQNENVINEDNDLGCRALLREVMP